MRGQPKGQVSGQVAARLEIQFPLEESGTHPQRRHEQSGRIVGQTRWAASLVRCLYVAPAYICSSTYRIQETLVLKMVDEDTFRTNDMRDWLCLRRRFECDLSCRADATSLYLLETGQRNDSEQQEDQHGGSDGKFHKALAPLPVHGNTANGSTDNPRSGAVIDRVPDDTSVSLACQYGLNRLAYSRRPSSRPSGLWK